MRILVTGASGSIGGALLPALAAAGHEPRAFARDPARVATAVPVDVVAGDAITGAGLDAALDGIEVAYFLIHSMEGDGAFEQRERRAAEQFVAAARRAGVRRVVYLGGLVPQDRPPSAHLRSRLAVERLLLAGVPEAVALRASIVVGARSRSFRFLVRLVERLHVLTLPAWRVHRTQPIDGRDVSALLVAAAGVPGAAGGLSLDVVGPDVLTYGQIVERIADAMHVQRRALRLGRDATPVAAPLAAAVTGEDPAFVTALMESLGGDLLPRDERAAQRLGVRLHGFDRAVTHALREWERDEPLGAR